MLRDPELRDPRGYILPSDQPDFPTATKFVNALIKTGVTVHRATASFTVGGKTYPAGSYVVKTAQAFRPHVLDMFEPQDHPNDFRYPGGPPIPPYDNAGWTLAFQMGVKFDRILDGFDGPFEKIAGMVKAPPERSTPRPPARLDARPSRQRQRHRRQPAAQGERGRCSGRPEGGVYVPAARERGRHPAKDGRGIRRRARTPRERPGGELVKLRMPRIGLWDTYGGSMPSGWTRWIFEQYEFPFEVVFPRRSTPGA